MQRQYQWNVAEYRRCIAGAVQNVKIVFLYSPRQGYLFPNGVETFADNDNVYVFGILQASVNTWCHKHKVFVLRVYLL